MHNWQQKVAGTVSVAAVAYFVFWACAPTTYFQPSGHIQPREGFVEIGASTGLSKITSASRSPPNTGSRTEQPDSNCSPCPTHTVHGNRTHGIVDSGFFNRQAGEHNKHATDRSGKGCHSRAHNVTAGCDGHQSGQCSVKCK